MDVTTPIFDSRGNINIPTMENLRAVYKKLYGQHLDRLESEAREEAARIVSRVAWWIRGENWGDDT